MTRLAIPAGAYRRPRPREPVFALAPSPAGTVGRTVAILTFAALLTATVALNAFRIGGFPIRGFVTAGALLLSILFNVEIARLVLRRNLLLIGLATGLAALGIFVSIVNGAPPSAIVKSLAEVHLQAVATIMVAGILAEVAGARACAMVIVAVIGTSACVAVAQMMDIHSAWALRRSLGPLPAEEIDGLNFLERRPTGLSYSPIQLSTHLCLAFAAFVAVRDRLRGTMSGADPLVMPALLALFAACIACATRSPILGGFIFLAAYVLQRRTSGLPLLLIPAAVLAYLAWPLLMGVIETYAPRVARADDNSAAARSTLVYYGLRLFADNPLGYGLTFAPMTLWNTYWPDLYLMPAPKGARLTDLHNYIMNMVNIYGIGIMLFAPIVAKLLSQSKSSLIFFIPYIVHILFHNSGPFLNDNVIWFVVAAIAAAGAATVDRSDPTSAPVGRGA